MTEYQIAFLAMVVAAMLVFAVVIAWVSSKTGRKD